MDPDGLIKCLSQMSDNSLLYHGYTNYMRDYEMIVYRSADSRSGIQPRYLRFLFVVCPEASVQSTLEPAVWSRSMDPKLLTERYVTEESSGYVWGVQAQELYPGPKVIENSARARRWADSVGVQFYEVDVEGNAHRINLVFSHLSVEEAQEGYSPFMVGRTMVAEAYEMGSKMPRDLWEVLPRSEREGDSDA
jgi:hypothetical protein